MQDLHTGRMRDLKGVGFPHKHSARKMAQTPCRQTVSEVSQFQSISLRQLGLYQMWPSDASMSGKPLLVGTNEFHKQSYSALTGPELSKPSDTMQSPTKKP